MGLGLCSAATCDPETHGGWIESWVGSREDQGEEGVKDFEAEEGARDSVFRFGDEL